MAFSLIGPRTGGQVPVRHQSKIFSGVKSFSVLLRLAVGQTRRPASLGQNTHPTEIAMTQENNELVLDRLLDAPRDKVFRCWTDPELMKQWFAPKPYTVPAAKVDLRVGGASMVVMKSPEGQE